MMWHPLRCLVFSSVLLLVVTTTVGAEDGYRNYERNAYGANPRYGNDDRNAFGRYKYPRGRPNPGDGLNRGNRPGEGLNYGRQQNYPNYYRDQPNSRRQGIHSNDQQDAPRHRFQQRFSPDRDPRFSDRRRNRQPDYGGSYGRQGDYNRGGVNRSPYQPRNRVYGDPYQSYDRNPRDSIRNQGRYGRY